MGATWCSEQTAGMAAQPCRRLQALLSLRGSTSSRCTLRALHAMPSRCAYELGPAIKDPSMPGFHLSLPRPAFRLLPQPDGGGAGATSLQGHAPDAVAGPGPQPNLGEDEKRTASAGSAATDEQQQQQQQAPQCPPPAREQPCPKPPPCATCPRLPDSPQRAQEAQRKRMPWKPLLSHRDVRRGLSYYGSGERLQALVSKLQAGQPIKAYTLGGR